MAFWQRRNTPKTTISVTWTGSVGPLKPLEHGALGDARAP